AAVWPPQSLPGGDSVEPAALSDLLLRTVKQIGNGRQGFARRVWVVVAVLQEGALLAQGRRAGAEEPGWLAQQTPQGAESEITGAHLGEDQHGRQGGV